MFRPFLRVGYISNVRNSINAGDTNASKGLIYRKVRGCRMLGLLDPPKEGAVVRKLCKRPNEYRFKFRSSSFGGFWGGQIMNPPIFRVIASTSEGFGETEKMVPSPLLSDRFFRRGNAGYRSSENSKYSLLLVFTLFIFLFSSCGRKNRAGFGGQANVTFHAYHHSLPIDSFTVYLKFNTLDAPSDNEYDTQQASVKVNGQGQALISGLKKGDYYVFAKGWDPTIQKEVKGGMPYSVTSETNLSADIAVTED